MDIRIRKAIDADIGEIIEISKRTILACYPSFLGDKAVNYYIDSGTVEAFTMENLGNYSVMELDGKIVGFTVVKGNLIDLMMVDSVHHRKGLGTLLLIYAEDRIFDGHQVGLVESFKDNVQANNFYKKHGWVLIRKFMEPTYGIPMIRLEKSRQGEDQ